MWQLNIIYRKTCQALTSEPAFALGRLWKPCPGGAKHDSDSALPRRQKLWKETGLGVSKKQVFWKYQKPVWHRGFTRKMLITTILSK